MPKIFPIVKKITNVIISGSTNVLQYITGGVSLGNKTTGTTSNPTTISGTRFSFASVIMTMAGSIGTSINNKISGTGAYSAVIEGVSLTTTADLGTFPNKVGGRIVQVLTNLTQLTGVISATSTGSWTTPGFCVGPARNGNFATNANTLTVAASGDLLAVYATQFNKTDLTITSVTLSVYDKNVAGLVTPTTATVSYSLNSGTSYTVLYTEVGNVDFSVTPRTFNLTAAVAGSWASLSGFRIKINDTGASSATVSTYSVDAITLTVVANRTDTV